MTPAASPDAPEEEGVSRAELAYRRLRRGILGGAYRPGQRLRETQLAAALNASRTPVREALRRLQTDRLVEDVPGQGLCVARLEGARVREFYAFRMAMEGMAAEMAALHATDFDLAELADTLERMREAAGDPARAAKLNRRFHEGIHRAARNSFLNHAIASMSDFLALLPGTTYSLPGRTAEVLQEHEAVLRAIAARDPVAAGAAMRAHLGKAAQVRMRLDAVPPE